MTWLLRAWVWAKDHKHLVAIAALAVACFFAGRYTAQRPAVHEVDLSHYEDDGAEFVQSHQAVAPIADGSGVAERITRKFAPVVCPPVPGPDTGFTRPHGSEPQLLEEVIERGPVTSDATTATVEHKTEDRKLELTIAPSTSAQWALQAGFEDVLRAKRLRVAARRRLFGPLWAEAAVEPATRAVGVAVAVEW